MADTKKIALELVKLSEEIVAKCREIKIEQWPQDLIKLEPIVHLSVLKIEEYAAQAGGLTGPEKKEVLVKFIDELIDLPWYFEKFDGIAIEWLVDHVVILLNKALGKNWTPFIDAQKAVA